MLCTMKLSSLFLWCIMLFRFLISLYSSLYLFAADGSKQSVEFPVHLQPFKEFFASLGYDAKGSQGMEKAILKISRVFFRTSTPRDHDNKTVHETLEVLKKMDSPDSKSELDEFLYKIVSKPHGSYKGYGRSKEDFFLELNS